MSVVFFFHKCSYKHKDKCVSKVIKRGKEENKEVKKQTMEKGKGTKRKRK